MAAWDAVHFIELFDVLYISGLITLTATVLTAWLSPSIRSSSTWFMLIWSWLLYSASYILIVGKQTGPEPLPAVCLFQAMLIYGIRVLCSLYGCSLALQVYWSVQGAINGKKVTRYQLMMLHAMPNLLCLAISILVLVLGLMHPELIARNALGMFCRLVPLYPARITDGVVIFAMVINVVFTARVFRLVRRHEGILSVEQKVPYFSPDVLMRVMVLTCCSIMGVGVSVLEFLPSIHATDGVVEILLASLPLILGLTFGTQMDILCVWRSFLSFREKDPGDIEIRRAAA